jgi:hypothetical protein
VVTCTKEETYPLVQKLFPDVRIQLVIHLLIVAETCFPSFRGGRAQTAEEELPRRGGKEGHLQVLRNWIGRWQFTCSEHVLQRYKVESECTIP